MKEDKLFFEARNRAIKALTVCVRGPGFFASGLKGGYEAVWARDSMIASLGASLVESKFKSAIAGSLRTLSGHQSKHGQIPNAVGSYNIERRSDITFNSIDSTLWYLLGHKAYARFFGSGLMALYRKNIDRAFLWLEYQDPNEDGLLAQQPTMDWQDAFPHKYGRVLSTQALYYTALQMYGKKKQAERLRRIVNGETEKYLALWSSKFGFYLPWIWKTHGPGVREEAHWFDTLGNLLAIVSGLATPKIAQSILRYIDAQAINRPYPCKAIWPPIKKGDSEWHDYFSESESAQPFNYLNAGIWPFIGGFYVAALVKIKKFRKAKKELKLLAEANMKVSSRVLRSPSSSDRGEGGGFHEWLHGGTGRIAGGSSQYQAWSAGAYIFAYECVKRRKVPFFN